ncbi:MAG: hypothetical protein PHH85_01995 [Candidatus Methanoperedens sp.]|nr:hypothetical protein [Candidatus Methanoperedens sp.]
METNALPIYFVKYTIKEAGNNAERISISPNFDDFAKNLAKEYESMKAPHIGKIVSHSTNAGGIIIEDVPFQSIWKRAYELEAVKNK